MILDAGLLLIEPATASEYAELQRAAEDAPRPKPAVFAGDGDGTTAAPPRVEDQEQPTGTAVGVGGAAVVSTLKKQFYGSIELDPIQAKKQFADLVDEVVLQFTSRPGVKSGLRLKLRPRRRQGSMTTCSVQ